MNITLNIEAPGLAKAIQALAEALSNTNVGSYRPDGFAWVNDAQPSPTVKEKQPVQPVQPTPVAQEVHQPQATPVQNVVPMNVPNAVPNAVPTAPVQQVQQTEPIQQTQAVPTSAPSYDMNQLAVAATQLMDAGRQSELLSLLASFGVGALMQLPQEQYGVFATKLRELGAQI